MHVRRIIMRKAAGRSRDRRLEAIRRLLASARIHSQRELASRLRGSGFRVTQATLSRDLRALGVARHPDAGGGSVYGLPQAPQAAERAVRSALAGFIGMSFSGNLAVARTLPGYAASVAAVFDGAGVKGLLGTVAGDDTILLVMEQGVSGASLRRAVRERLPELGKRIR